MRKVLFLALLLPSLWAKSYMGKIEPIQSYDIYAQTSGEVIALDTNDEHTLFTGTLITLDSTLERLRLKRSQNQLTLYKEQLDIRQSAYDKANAMTTKSQTEKDSLLLSLLDLKFKIQELQLKIEELQNTLEHKSIEVSKLYVKQFFVNMHDYVSVGKKMVQLFDTSKAKIVLFVHKSDIEGIKSKKIFLNGTLSKATFAKIDTTTDADYVSSYQVELHLDQTNFGDVVSVEFK